MRPIVRNAVQRSSMLQEEDENVDAASSEEVDDEVPDGADIEDSEGGAEEVDAEPEESAEAKRAGR